MTKMNWAQMNWEQTREALIKINSDFSRLPEKWAWGINLTRANLSGANLSRANLSGVIGLVHINFTGFSMDIQLEKSKIGCEYRLNSEWEAMTIEQAVALGIERKHFEAYRKFYDAAIIFLRGQK